MALGPWEFDPLRLLQRLPVGNGRIAAPVRYTRRGRQVQLPGGSWVYCAKSCSETLRVKTVDFWYSDEGLGPDNSLTHDGGVFGKLGITFGW